MMTISKKQHKKLKFQKIFLILIILPEKKELKEINSLKNFLNDFDIKKIDTKSIIHEKFQKDNHKNKHVFFINLYDNLRAKNYRIPLSNEQKTKMIAGKIVPAIANTNAMLTGFACMQLISLLNSNDISLIKNCYFDSAFNFYQFNNPSDVINIQDQEYNPILDGPSIAIPNGWTVWDIINIKGPITSKEFIDYLKRKCNVNILGIAYNRQSIIQLFMPSKAKKLPLLIEEIYEKNSDLKKNQKKVYGQKFLVK